ncbi:MULTISPECIES: hybrid sensor histidine kinase/response regulator [unclassified Marinimicrobium]|jgi:signal transduction histidine kinase/DNA-binding response OmpR family regulator|uniref:hybrid sensor histidine kinase/response regulator n=1 Tax=unclassified Marinimicrobium TaxID=2632100 RepID=UPI000C5DA08F|nr:MULTISPECIES: ATP-binding protein [unclassified Marinimicrobium]MAN50994.1 hybrid sensor histidine kinase/response regulator [Marinimicrobium sp.]
MTAKQTIFRVRRQYNQWVANQTLEDYALRFTAKRARRWSPARVAHTALGAISFLALEAIGGAITLNYGFTNAMVAILAVSLVILLTAFPISYYAAKYGVDIDLLTRGAGFGYIGSTITSLIYASFTFIFFAIEAAIMAMALEMLFGIPIVWGYVLCAVVVIPLVTHGITFISRFQLWTQPLWVFLQALPFAFILWADFQSVSDWTSYTREAGGGFDLLLFGAASAVIFSLIAQIGEQVDYLRFMPEPKPEQRRRWWLALSAGGPGWIVIGALKMMAGSFLAVLALSHGMSANEAIDPTHMYQVAFGYVTQSPTAALAIAGLFVILSQLKINVTNAYAGSIAWSNFFSRLTHSHPGRVVWLVFNVTIALLVMELGVYRALENTLGLYALIAIAWVGTLVADLVINKPLGFSPPHIEFKRAHLYDINPVGVGTMITATLIGVIGYLGFWGETFQALSHFITLLSALVIAPLIAWRTGGRYYIAREPIILTPTAATHQCCICEHRFDKEDVTHCPAYDGPICSLCCSLDARCNDFCKPGASYPEQIRNWVHRWLPSWLIPDINARLGNFLLLVIGINGFSGVLLSLIYQQTAFPDEVSAMLFAALLWKVFFILVIITGVVSWLFVLAHESRVVAQEESQRQTRLLMEEIDAHEQTDQALQRAKEQADAANQAKSRYLTGISHELRSPLNAVLGYAQLLEKDPAIPPHRRDALGVIRRSGEHLADLIEGLLDISKIEAGRLDLHRDQVRLGPLLEQLVHMFRLQAEGKGLQFEYHCQDPLPPLVRADEKRLRQILINLLSNAIKYTAHGRVSMRVKYRSDVAEFTIEDSGEGISPDDQQRIFRPFERIRRPGEQVSGTGLGLTITQLLTDIMGGDISLQSTPGQGSVFKVTLMMSRIRGASDIAPTEAQDIQGYRGEAKRVMVVDDEASHRQLVHAMLTPLGFDVVEVDNSLTVLDRVRQEAPDLILLDVSMPGLNGWELVAQLRAMDYYQPVVMISADASEGKAVDTALHDAYIVKPVRLNSLLETLGQQLNLRWHTRPVAISTPASQPPRSDKRITALTLPDEVHLQPLRKLALIGHKSGLQQALAELEANGLATEEFVQTLTRLAGQFQFETIIRLLQVPDNELQREPL